MAVAVIVRAALSALRLVSSQVHISVDKHDGRDGRKGCTVSGPRAQVLQAHDAISALVSK